MAAEGDKPAPTSSKRALKGIKLRPAGGLSNVKSAEEAYKVMQWEIRGKSSRRTKNFVEKPPTPSERIAALRPYAEAVGQANFEWNNLQQWLSLCFWFLFEPSGEEATAVWDSVLSDRTQRNLLLEAAKVKFIARSHHPNTTNDQLNACYKTFDCIEFLVETAGKFEDLRNNAIHAPVKVNVAAEHFLVYADDQHVRGSALKKKMSTRNTNIIDELEHLRSSLRFLNEFASKFWHAWVKNEPLPKVPRMPTLVRRKSRRQSHPKVLPR